nr:MAG TPA: hypothetical protein [Caudoviricetes sp.]DAI68523.1 MAG TPA: hypothetical protein [Caudoviricetes sp.]
MSNSTNCSSESLYILFSIIIYSIIHWTKEPGALAVTRMGNIVEAHLRLSSFLSA